MSEIIHVINMGPLHELDPYSQRKDEILKTRANRALSIVEQSKQYGFAVRFWEGISGHKLRQTNVCKAFKQIVRFAKEAGLRYVRIAEDDMVLTSADSWEYYLAHQPKKFDLYSGGLYGGEIQGNRIVNGFSGNTLVTFSERFYDFVLSAKETDHLDQWLGNFCFEREYIICRPFVVKQLGGYSENQRRFVTYEGQEAGFDYL